MGVAAQGHGRAGWIHHGCRCEVCHAALLEYSRNREALVALRRGRMPALRVPAGPSRRMITLLRKRGLSVAEVAALAGISVRTAYRIHTGGVQRVSARTELALVAVR
jgi:hypothetical protein